MAGTVAVVAARHHAASTPGELVDAFVRLRANALPPEGNDPAAG
jgi:hypothetical protein